MEPMDKFKVIRREYPATEGQVYLDTSTTGLVSRSSYEAMKEVLDKRHLEGVSISGYWKSWEDADAWRQEFAGMIGAQADEVFYGKDSSDMLNIFAGGITIPQGKNVLVPDVSFLSTRNVWLNQANRGVEVRYVRNRDGVVTTDQLIDSIDENTFAVSICSVEPSSGYHYDVRRLGEACRIQGVFLVVDTTQSLGAMDFDVAAMKVDVMVVSTYKWMCNVFGFGLGYIRRNVMEQISPRHVGWTGIRDRKKDFGNLELVLHEGAQKYETGGLNWVGLSGAKASVATYMELGKEDVQAQILKLTNLLYQEMAGVDKAVIDPALPEINRSGIVYLKAAEGVTWKAEHFETRGIRINLAGNRMRVGMHFYNNEEDVMALVAALKEATH